MSFKPGSRLGHYVIVEEVGHGGMATVYRARQESLHRDVAIKVLPDLFAHDTEFRERFSREAATIARLRHPNIVTVFDFGEEDGIPYIVTEFVEGETLQHHLRQALPPTEVVRLLRPLASALDYAHEHDVLHRDVKPSNILLTAEDTPILTDFGLSRIVGSLPPLTRTGLPLGTPEYMAPELASGGVASSAADRYSFAVLAFQMLAGQLPYGSEAPLATLLAHVHEPTPRLTAKNPGLPAKLDDVFARALEKEPSSRFSSATALVEAIEAAVSPPTRPEPPRSVEGGSAPAPSMPLDADEDEPGSRRLVLRALLDALQSTPALLCFGAAALAASYAAILAPAAGGRHEAITASILGSMGGAWWTLRRAPQRYGELAVEATTTRRQQQAEREHEELRRLEASLHSGFEGAGCAEGTAVLAALAHEFAQLDGAAHADAPLPLSMTGFPGLVTEAYRRGLSVLVDALELVTTASAPGPERLRQEVSDLETEIAALEHEGAPAQRIALRRQALASNRERLHLLADLQIRVDQLFYQARQCEASLHRSRISLAAMRAGGDSTTSVDSVTRALQRTIEQARVVQDEVKKLGY